MSSKDNRAGQGDTVATEHAVVKASCLPHVGAEVGEGGAKPSFQVTVSRQSKSKGP